MTEILHPHCEDCAALKKEMDRKLHSVSQALLTLEHRIARFNKTAAREYLGIEPHEQSHIDSIMGGR